MFCIECRAYGIDSHFASTKGCLFCLFGLCTTVPLGAEKNYSLPTAQEPGARHGEPRAKLSSAERSLKRVPACSSWPQNALARNVWTSWNLLHLFCFNARRWWVPLAQLRLFEHFLLAYSCHLYGCPIVFCQFLFGCLGSQDYEPSGLHLPNISKCLQCAPTHLWIHHTCITCRTRER